MDFSNEQAEEIRKFTNEILRELYGNLENVITAYPIVKNHKKGVCPFCEEEMVEEPKDIVGECTYACDSCPWCYKSYDKNPENHDDYIKYRRVKNKAESLKN